MVSIQKYAGMLSFPWTKNLSGDEIATTRKCVNLNSFEFFSKWTSIWQNIIASQYSHFLIYFFISLFGWSQYVPWFIIKDVWQNIVPNLHKLRALVNFAHQVEMQCQLINLGSFNWRLRKNWQDSEEIVLTGGREIIGKILKKQF